MNPDARLQRYLDAIAIALIHVNRGAAMRAYCTALLLPSGRKNIELMAARVMPDQAQAKHQSLHHLVAKAGWRDEAVLAVVLELVLPAMQRRAKLRTWLLDSIELPKQGTHSVGVARQAGQHSGKVQNMQVAVSLSVATGRTSVPVAYRLFLPHAWTDDPVRRSAAGIPDEVVFQTKAAIALQHIRRAMAAGIPAGVVLGGLDYGGADIRSALDEFGLPYALAVHPSTGAHVPSGVSHGEGTVSVEELATVLSARTGQRVAWSEKGERVSSRFAATRVRPAYAGVPASLCPERWLLLEWPVADAGPTSYWLSSLPAKARLQELVRTVRSHGRSQQDIEELKAMGLGHYEGRGWRGFHHHATLCIASYGFLVSERCLLPAARRLTADQIALPERPRGLRTRRSPRLI